MIFTEKLTKALDTAALLHKDHIRIGKEKIPYITHLIHVMAIVDRHGGDEDTLIAALLHDTIEDVPDYTLEKIREDFGDKIAIMVGSLTEERLFDPSISPREKWIQSKKSYIEKLKNSTNETKLISAADKIHNMSSILQGYRDNDEKLILRFDGDALKGQLWFLHEVFQIIKDDIPHDLVMLYTAHYQDLQKLNT